MTDDLVNRFGFHPAAPDSSAAALHAQVRTLMLECARIVDDLVPDGREKAVTLTKLEEAMFWANAGIARQEPLEEETPEPHEGMRCDVVEPSTPNGEWPVTCRLEDGHDGPHRIGAFTWGGARCMSTSTVGNDTIRCELVNGHAGLHLMGVIGWGNSE